MDKFKEIRPVVIGIARNEDALKREYKEELGVDIEIEKYLRIGRKHIYISR